MNRHFDRLIMKAGGIRQVAAKMAVGPQPQHHQIQTASLFQLAIVLSGVVQRQLVNVLFFDLRRGKKQLAQIRYRDAFSRLAAKRDLIEVVIVHPIIECFAFHGGGQMLIHPLWRAPRRHRQIHPPRRRDIAQNMMAGDQAHLFIIFGHNHFHLVVLHKHKTGAEGPLKVI